MRFPGAHPLYEGYPTEGQKLLAQRSFGPRPFFPSLYEFDDIAAVAAAGGSDPLGVQSFAQRQACPRPIIGTKNYVPVNDGAGGLADPIEGDGQFGTTGNPVAWTGAAAGAVSLGTTAIPLNQVIARGTGSSVAAFRAVAAGVPVSPVDGDFWNETTRNFQGRFQGINQSFAGAMFRTGAPITVVNTTTQTSLIGAGQGTLTLPASFGVVNKGLRFRASGTFGITGTPTLTIRLKKGTTTGGAGIVLNTGAQTPVALTAARMWRIDVDLIYNSTTVLVGNGFFEYIGGAAAVGNPTFWEFGTGAGATIVTGSENIDLTAQWGTANAANIITCTDFSMEVLG